MPKTRKKRWTQDKSVRRSKRLLDLLPEKEGAANSVITSEEKTCGGDNRVLNNVSGKEDSYNNRF